MAVHEKHYLLVTSLLIFVFLVPPAEVFLYVAYRTDAAKAVHIPNDVLRAGPGLAGMSAIIGAFFGLAFAGLATVGRGGYDSSLSTVGYVVFLLLVGIPILIVASLTPLRRSFLPADRQRERDQLGPAAWWYEIRWLQLEPYVTAHELERRYCYAAELAEAANQNTKDLAKIRPNILGLPTFLRLYFGDGSFRDRNGVRMGVVCSSGLAVAVLVSMVWLLTGTPFEPGMPFVSSVIAPAATVEMLIWPVLRWRYERIRLLHMADARAFAASEIRRLAWKKLRLDREGSDPAISHTNASGTALDTPTLILLAWITLSRWRRRARPERGSGGGQAVSR